MAAARAEAEAMDNSDDDYNLDFLDNPEHKGIVKNVDTSPVSDDISTAHVSDENTTAPSSLFFNFTASTFCVKEVCNILMKMDKIEGEASVLKRVFVNRDVLLSAFHRNLFQQWHLTSGGHLPHQVLSALFVLSFASADDLAREAFQCLTRILHTNFVQPELYTLSIYEIEIALIYFGFQFEGSGDPNIGVAYRNVYSNLLAGRCAGNDKFCSDDISIISRLKAFFSCMATVYSYACTSLVRRRAAKCLETRNDRETLSNGITDLFHALLLMTGDPSVQRYCISECVSSIVSCVRLMIYAEIHIIEDTCADVSCESVTSAIKSIVKSNTKYSHDVSIESLTAICVSLTQDLCLTSVRVQRIFWDVIMSERLLYSEEDSESTKSNKLFSMDIWTPHYNDEIKPYPHNDLNIASSVQELAKQMRSDSRNFILQRCRNILTFLTLIYSMFMVEGVKYDFKIGDKAVDIITSMMKTFVEIKLGLRDVTDMRKSSTLDDMIKCVYDIDFVWSSIKSKRVSKTINAPLFGS